MHAKKIRKRAFAGFSAILPVSLFLSSSVLPAFGHEEPKNEPVESQPMRVDDLLDQARTDSVCWSDQPGLVLKSKKPGRMNIRLRRFFFI